MAAKIRVGIIGAGSYAARAHVPNLQAIPDVSIVAACRTREDKLHEFNSQFGIPGAYTDYRELLDREKPDAVVIATPHHLHFEQAVAALDRGIAVLLEKPMVLKVEEARVLVKKVRKSRGTLVVGYNRHWNSHFRRARQMIFGGEMGEVTAVFGQFAADVAWLLERSSPPEDIRDRYQWRPGDRPNFRGSWEESGGGMFVDGGTHLVDAVLWMTGLFPTECTAFMDNQGYETDANTGVVLRFPGGRIGTLSVLGTSRRLPEKGIQIYGTRGTLHVSDDYLRYEFEPGKTLVAGDLPPGSNAAANLIGIMRGECANECDVVDGAKAVSVVSAVYESVREARTVVVQPFY